MIPPLLPRELRPNLAVFDREERPVLLGCVKETFKDEMAARDALLAILRAVGTLVPFGMTADKQTIQFFGWEGGELTPLVRFSTPGILTAYEVNFSHKPIYHAYLITLLDSWLNDLTSRWKQPFPPGIDALVKIGLIDHITGGMSYDDLPIE